MGFTKSGGQSHDKFKLNLFSHFKQWTFVTDQGNLAFYEQLCTKVNVSA